MASWKYWENRRREIFASLPFGMSEIEFPENIKKELARIEQKKIEANRRSIDRELRRKYENNRKNYRNIKKELARML